MKKIVSLFTLATILLVTLNSCTSSRKSGCPMNQQASYRYR